MDNIFYDDFANKLNIEQYREDASWKVKTLLSVIPENQKYNNVLEIGCGMGLVLKDIADAVKAEYRTGIDISENALNLAQKEQEGTFTQLNINQEPLPFPNKHFDLVIISDLLEHIDKPDTLLNESSRISKAILLKIPAERCWMHPNLRENHAGGHVHTWIPSEILIMLENINSSCLKYDLVEPPLAIQYRNWNWHKRTINPLYWSLMIARWLTWNYRRKLWRTMWGTTVVAYLEIEGFQQK